MMEEEEYTIKDADGEVSNILVHTVLIWIISLSLYICLFLSRSISPIRLVGKGEVSLQNFIKLDKVTVK